MQVKRSKKNERNVSYLAYCMNGRQTYRCCFAFLFLCFFVCWSALFFFFCIPFVHGRVRSGYELKHALDCVIRRCFARRSHTFGGFIQAYCCFTKCLPYIHVHNGGMNFVLMY